MINNKEQALTFSRNLKNYIYKSGKTQRKVAEELGFNPTTFNTWCVGKIVPSLGKVQRIADYFGINKSDLLEHKDNDGITKKLSAFEVALLTKFLHIYMRFQRFFIFPDTKKTPKIKKAPPGTKSE